MKKKIMSLGLTMLVFLTSCSVKSPDVSVESYRITSIDLKDINSIIYLNITNPNDAELGVKKVDYIVSVNGVEDSASGSTNKKLKVSKNSTKNIIELPVSIHSSKILPVFKTIIQSPSEIRYKVSGKIYFDTFFGEINIPFSKKSVYDNRENIAKLKSKMKALDFMKFF